MIRKIVAVWVSLAMLFSLVVIMDVVTDITPPVKAATITVDDSGGADYLTIQEGIDAADEGDSIFVYGGVYYENIILNKTLSLIGEDRNTTIIDGQSFGCAINVSASGVNISGFTIIRNNPSSYHGGGIVFYGVHGCNIQKNNISYYGYGILFVDSVGNSISENVVFDNNIFGIYLINSTENIISNNNISFNIDGIRLYLSSNNNTIYRNKMNKGGIVIWSASDNIITHNYGSIIFLIRGSCGNHISNNTADSIRIQDESKFNHVRENEVINGGIGLIDSADNNIVTLNNIHDNEDGLYISSSSLNNITHNLITNNDFGIRKSSASRNEIRYNTIVSNSKTGIHFGSHSGVNLISDNNISNNEDGIIFEYLSNGNLITKNVISNNTNGISLNGDLMYFNDIISNEIYNNQKGIYINNKDHTSTLKDSKYHWISDNEIYKNRVGICFEVDNKGIIEEITINSSLIYDNDIGIEFDGSRGKIINGSTISNCTIENNRIGIYMNQVEYSKIINNTFRNNHEYAIQLIQSENNLIYHNNFINNTQSTQAYDTTIANLWNAPYHEGGNYWSDYIGTDIMCGPNQNQTGSDGIGDHPYSLIGSSNKDIYPLMSPHNLGNNVPFGPRNLTARTGDGYVYLSWDIPYHDGGSSIISYNIYRDGLDIYINVSANQLWYNDTKVSNGITYAYFINAENSHSESPNTTINATPMTRPQTPQNPLIKSGDGYANISWNAPLDDGGSTIINYIIFRSNVSGEEGTQIAEIGNILFYNDTDVINNVTYFYRVMAQNDVGNSSLSNEVSATPTIFSSDQPTDDNEFFWWIIVLVIITVLIIIGFLYFNKKK